MPNRFSLCRLTRRAALVGLAPMLAGCANQAAMVGYDRSSGTRLRQVAVLLPGFPPTPSVGVNGRLNSSFFSVPLAVVGAAMDNNRTKELTEVLAQQNFKPAMFMQSALASVLRQRGVSLALCAADPARKEFAASYGADLMAGMEAALDVVVTDYGFLALSSNVHAPYRPRLTLDARLVAADHSVLMSDHFDLDNIYWRQANSNPSRPRLDFSTYAEVIADPRAAAAALQTAMVFAASRVVSRFV